MALASGLHASHTHRITRRGDASVGHSNSTNNDFTGLDISRQGRLLETEIHWLNRLTTVLDGLTHASILDRGRLLQVNFMPPC